MADKQKKPLIEIVANIEMYIAMAALAVVVVMNFIEIVLRAAMGHSFMWIQEFSVLMMLWMIFMGFVKIAYINKDVYIDYLVNALPKPMHDAITIIANVLILIFLGILTYFGCRLWMQQLGVRTIVARIPQVLNTTPVIICFVSLIFVYGNNIVKLLKERKGGEN